MFFKELKLDFDEMNRLLSSDGAAVSAYMDKCVSRRFYIGDTDINRKTLKDWEDNELLPYEYDEDGWRKFSFIEWVWLECIMEFRRLGVALDKIREIKKKIFDASGIFEYFREQVFAYKGEIDRKEEIMAKYLQNMSDEQKKSWAKELQLSPFLIHLLFLIVKNQNLCIVYNNSELCSFVVMGKVDTDMKSSNDSILANVINDSFVVLNLRKIVDNIFQKSDLRRNDDFIIDFLSEKEQRILERIRETNAKEIVITFDNGKQPTYIKVARNRISQEILNKVARYLKKGSYQNIEFKTRNGELINYEETDIIKLDE